MASRFASRLASRLLHRPSSAVLHNYQLTVTTTTTTIPTSQPLISFIRSRYGPSQLRFLSSRSGPRPHRPLRPDIGARARQMQTRRLWTYALAFSGVAVFVVIVLNQFQDQLIFYFTPSDALAKYAENPNKTKFRLGGLVLEGSVAQIPFSPEMDFVVTDGLTDILVKYEGPLPDLFREGNSVVVDGFIKPFTDEMKAKYEGNSESKSNKASQEARKGEYYFKAIEVLAKHDEKYMPEQIASKIEVNKKKKLATLQQQQEQAAEAEVAV